MIAITCAHCGAPIREEPSPRRCIQLAFCEDCEEGAYGIVPDNADDPESFGIAHTDLPEELNFDR